MIQNRRYRILCDERAKITSGEKTDKGRPRSLSYFDVSPFPELVKEYGDKPEELYLYFPSDNIPDFFNDEYNLYGSNNQKKRSCDGVTCIHRIPETVNGVTYEAGQESPCVCKDLPEKDKNKCKYVMYLKAWIVLLSTGKIENPLCYIFRTHSKNSGDTIYSELEKMKILTGGVLRGVKFQINVRMVAGKDDAKKRFPIWSLQSVGMMSDIRQQVTAQAHGIIEEVKAFEQEEEEPEDLTDYAEKIKELLVKYYPGETKEAKSKKGKLVKSWFGTTDWEKIKSMPSDVLKRSYEGLEEELSGRLQEVEPFNEDEDLPFDEEGEPVETQGGEG